MSGKTPLAVAMPTIGIYVRKSSQKQGDLSLPAQERLCRRFLAQYLPHQRGAIRVYADVLSGTRADRRDYQRMLADARAGRLQVLVFHKVNRFGRDSAEGLMAVQELRRLGVEVRVADFPTLDLARPEGMFIFTFLLGAGQFEVENLGTESRKGMREKAERGGWPFLAPYGYVNRHREISSRKRECWVEVERHAAAVVRLMFRWYATGNVSLVGIVRRLARLHRQRTQAGRPGVGRRWSSQTIYRTLTNRFYVGEVRVPAWQLTRPAAHRAIIPRALFDRVQQVLAAQGRGPTQQHVYALQGLLWQDGVALCATTVQRRGRTYRYYYRYIGDRRVYCRADELEQAVIDRIRACLQRLGPDPQAAAQGALEAQIAELGAQARARLERLAAQRQRVLHLGRTFAFSEAEVAAELERMAAEEAAAQRDRDQADLLGQLHGPLIETALADLGAIGAWGQLSASQQQQVLARMVMRVEVDPNGQVASVEWHLLWERLWAAFA